MSGQNIPLPLRSMYLNPSNDATPKWPVNQPVQAFPGTAFYRYVKVTIGGSTANTLEPGRPVYWDSFMGGTVKTDKGGVDKAFAGVLLNRMTSGNYGWIQTSGRALVCLTSALTIDSNLIADPANGCLKVASAATDVVVGNNIQAGTVPLPGDATTGDITPIVNAAGTVTGFTVVTAGALLDNGVTYVILLIDPNNPSNDSASHTTNTVLLNAEDLVSVVPTFVPALGVGGGGGSGYSPITIVRYGVTPVFLRAPHP